MTTVNPKTGEILTGRFNIEDIGVLADEQLLAVYSKTQVEALLALEAQQRLEQEIQRRITEAGGTTLFGKDMNYVVETKIEYDRTKLFPILELFDTDATIRCFTPAHQETRDVPDKWDMTQVKKYAKARGNEALAIVESATFPGKASGKLVATGEADG